MDQNNIQEQIVDLQNSIDALEAISLKVNLDPDTVAIIKNIITPMITALQVSLPTLTYSTTAPTGVAPKGSVWFQNSGSVPTNGIFSYSGSAWVQIK
jgi:hypothetical protein